MCEKIYMCFLKHIVDHFCVCFFLFSDQPTQVGILFTFLARQMARHENTIFVNRILFEQVGNVFLRAYFFYDACR